MNWSEIVRRLRQEYLLDRQEDGWIELHWRFREGETARRQTETVTTAEAFGATFLVVSAPVLAGESLAPAAALRHNATLAIGALATDEDELVVRALLPMAELTVAELDRALYAVAHEAARLSVPASTTGHVVFEHYCD